MATKELIEALYGEQKRSRETNPLLAGAQALNQVQYSPTSRETKRGTPDWKRAALFTLGQTLASGILGGFGERRQQQENQDDQARLFGALRSADPAAAVSQDRDFSHLAPMMQMEQLEKQREVDSQTDLLRNRAQIEREFSGLNDPGMTDLIAKAYSGQELTPEENARLANAPIEIQRLVGTAQYRQDVQGRSDRSMEFREGERSLPGYTNVSGATPGSTTVRELRAKVRGTEQAKHALNQLIESGDRAGFMTLLGQDAALQAALSGALINAGRVSTGSGANFTKTEQGFITAGLPKTLAGDPMGAIQALFLQRDQKEFAKTMLKFIDVDTDIQLFAEGFKNNNRPLSFYPEDKLRQFGLFDQARQDRGGLGVQDVVPQTQAAEKVIGGHRYRKVPGGWELVE